MILDKTCFYPAGGGQPHDLGIISFNGQEHKVIEVKKGENEEVLHLLDSIAPIGVGDKIRGFIDWNRRYMHMRHHTALHVMDAIVEKEQHAGITGGQIYVEKARLDFNFPGLNKEKSLEIIAKAQEIIDRCVPVIIKTLTRDEALAIPGLARTQPGEELLRRLDHIRVVEISGIDAQMDGGLHVSNTKEIGKIRLLSYENKGASRKRIEISVLD